MPRMSRGEPTPPLEDEPTDLNFDLVDALKEAKPPESKLPEGTINPAKVKLPPYPGKIINWDQWEAWASKLTDEQWTRLCGYLYRLFPVIQRTSDYAFIDKMSRFEPIEYFREAHGGGSYSFKVNDVYLPKKETCFTTVRFEIDWNEVAPRLNLYELDLESQKNTAFVNKLAAEGRIRNGKIVNPNDPTGAVEKLVDGLMKQSELLAKGGKRDSDVEEKATGRAIDMVANTADKLLTSALSKNPMNESLGTLEKLVALVKGGNGGDSAITTLLPIMMQIMQSSQTQMLELFKQQSDANRIMLETLSKGKDGGNDFGKMESMLGFMGRLLEFKADALGGGGEKSIGTRALDLIEGALPMVLNPIAQVVAAKVAQQAAAPGAAVAPAAATLMPVPPQPSQQNGEVMTEPQPINGAAPEGAPNQQQMAQFISQYGQFLIKAMGAGQTGEEFGQNLELTLGYDVYATVLPYFRHPEYVAEVAKVVPQFYQVAIAGPGFPAFKAFLEGVVNWNVARNEPEATGA